MKKMLITVPIVFVGSIFLQTNIFSQVKTEPDTALKRDVGITKTLPCCECEGLKRLMYDTNFYEKCKLCRGKGTVTLDEIRNNQDYFISVPYFKTGNGGNSLLSWTGENSMVVPKEKKIIRYDPAAGTIAKAYKVKQEKESTGFSNKFKVGDRHKTGKVKSKKRIF